MLPFWPLNGHRFRTSYGLMGRCNRGLKAFVSVFTKSAGINWFQIGYEVTLY